jgi:2,4-dienoyl-CoA reductase-like NADH-dependent reductase (Old Yellow Enzyme family)
MHPALEPITIGRLSLPNRAVVAPMSRLSTAGDGVPTPIMVRYFAEYARGGFGLVVTDGTYTDHAFSQAYAAQPAIVTAEQVEGWRAVVDAVHAEGGRILLQLMHAGALVQGNAHRDVAVAPSAVQPKGRKLGKGYGGSGPYAMPREITAAEVEEAIAGFAAAAARARRAGFDGVEIHGANGYLVDQFITRYTNRRTDRYGERARFAAEVAAAVRAAAGDELVVGIRLSQTKVNDIEYRWDGVAEGRAIFEAVGASGVDYIHIASEDAAWGVTSFLDERTSITGLAREVTGLPVIANGGLHDVELVTRVLTERHADLVSLGAGAIANPDWPRRVAAGEPLESLDKGMLSPVVTLENTERWRREQRERSLCVT